MNIKKYKTQYEYECACGHIWIDNENQGCPMCQNHNDIIRRNYVIPQPETFGKRYNKK